MNETMLELITQAEARLAMATANLLEWIKGPQLANFWNSYKQGMLTDKEFVQYCFHGMGDDTVQGFEFSLRFIEYNQAKLSLQQLKSK